jgi:hypothetical protein
MLQYFTKVSIARSKIGGHALAEKFQDVPPEALAYDFFVSSILII